MGICGLRPSAIRTALAASFALLALLSIATRISRADSAAFDLTGPRIQMTVTRAGKTLPISDVPNLQPGDRLWIHPDFPESQSVRYLLIVAFLRGSTNPPPYDWFTRAETWNKQVRQEGIVVTVPKDAQQTLHFSRARNRRRFQLSSHRRARQTRRICARLAGFESSQPRSPTARKISQRGERNLRTRIPRRSTSAPYSWAER